MRAIYRRYAFNIPGFEPRGTEFYNLGTRLPEQHNQALGLPRYSIVQVENNFFYGCFYQYKVILTPALGPEPLTLGS